MIGLEIKVFGKPNVEIIRIVKESLKKLRLEVPEICLAFAYNEGDIRKYRERFMKPRIFSPSMEKIEREIVKIELEAMNAAYISEIGRKENLPPVIIVNLASKVEEVDWEDSLFHEILHLKTEKMGWSKIGKRISFQVGRELCFQNLDFYILTVSNDCLYDFFGDEIASQYGFSDYVFRRKRRFIRNSIRKFEELSKKVSTTHPVVMIESAIRFAFVINFPPSYKDRERDQKILEKKILPISRHFPEYLDFQGLKSIPKEIKVPPEEKSLFKIYAKIFLIYNDFLNHFLK